MIFIGFQVSLNTFDMFYFSLKKESVVNLFKLGKIGHL